MPMHFFQTSWALCLSNLRWQWIPIMLCWAHPHSSCHSLLIFKIKSSIPIPIPWAFLPQPPLGFALCSLYPSVSTTFINIPFHPLIHLCTKAFQSSWAGVSLALEAQNCLPSSTSFSLLYCSSLGLQMWYGLFWGLGTGTHTTYKTVLKPGPVSAKIPGLALVALIWANSYSRDISQGLATPSCSFYFTLASQTSTLTFPVSLRTSTCPCQDSLHSCTRPHLHQRLLFL